MIRALLEFIGTVWEVFWRALVLDLTHCTGSIDAICAAVETLGVPTLPAAERPDGATLHEQV